MADDDVLYSKDTVFHYTRASTAIEHILHDRKLRLRCLRDTHDPREYNNVMFTAIGSGLGPNFLDELLQAQIRINDIARSQYRLACFCCNPTDIPRPTSRSDPAIYEFGFARSRMWSQFAEDHKGICIAFSASALRAAASKVTNTVFSGGVRYAQDAFITSRDRTLDGTELKKVGVEEYDNRWVRNDNQRIFFTKQSDYEAEREFRLVVDNPAGTVEYIDVADSIRGVLVGDRFADAYIPLIERISADLGILSKQVVWEDGIPYPGKLLSESE